MRCYMKTKFSRNVVMFLLCVMTIFMVCSFVGCKELAIPESDEKPGSNEIITELETKENPIGFKIALPAKSRAYYSQDDASKYVVELVMNGSVVETQNGTPGQTLTFTVKNEGTYTINVSAYNDENTLIADGSSSKSITFADGYVSVVVALHPKKIDNGTNPPPIENKVNIGIDIQWVQPEDRILTLENTGNSNFTRYSSSVNLGKSLVLEFTSGMQLYDIFRENDVSFWPDSYEMSGKKYEFQVYCEDANGNEYYDDSMLTDDITLYPVFRVVPKVTLNLNGGTYNAETDDIVIFTYSISKDEIWPYPTKDDLTFVGWTLTPDGDDFVYDIEDDITVYAKYIEAKTCTLTLQAPDYAYFTSISTGESLGSYLTLQFASGTTLGEIFYENDVNFYLESYFDIDGNLYIFDGSYEYRYEGEYSSWTESYYSGDVILDDIEISPRFYIQPLVTFNLNGGNIDGDTSDVVINTNYFNIVDSSVQPVKEGYTLIGWTLTPDGDDVVDHASSNITVYAKWADMLKLFESGDITGDFSMDGLPLTYQGEGIYSVDFVYSADMNAWASEYGTIQFKLRPVAGDWVTSFGMNPSVVPPVINGAECPLSLEAGNNIIVTGFEEGITYRVTIRCTENGNVFARVSTVE